MWDFLGRLVFNFKDVQSFSFQVGYISGVSVFVVLAVAVSIVYWIFFRYPRRSPGISIRAPLGTVFISSAAISDLVKSLERDFKCLEIVKVSLLDFKKFNRIEIQVNYALGGDGIPELAPALQEKSLDTLKKTFGVDCIKDVSVRVRRAQSPQGPFA